MEYFSELIEFIKREKPDKEALHRKKKELCRKYGLERIPTDVEVLLHGDKKTLPLIKRYLMTKPVRTGSGVAVIAIMTKPWRCPHGKCTFCPGGPGSVFGDVPQSYTGHEPATMRAIRNDYDAYLQVFNRLEQYILLGHNINKIELIVMGGTFPSMPWQYQYSFIKNALRGMNDFSSFFMRGNSLNKPLFKRFFEVGGAREDKERAVRVRRRIIALKRRVKGATLRSAQRSNEKSRVRDVALCVETRPDWCFERHINKMLRMGVTRVELGVQSTFNRALKATNRGHSVEDSIKATRLLKDSLLKVTYHMMLGLPTITREEDIESLREIVKNPDFMPDALKIYPCMVMKGTALYEQWRKGLFRPINTKEAAEVISEFKREVPEWLRIMRIQRDIPTKFTSAGVDKTNLRQYVAKLLEKKGIKCRCIRCREPGAGFNLKEKIKYKVESYTASGSKEYFISANSLRSDRLLGFLRLREVKEPFRPELKRGVAGIRELHVYGSALPFGSEGEGVQHRGIGKRLMTMAEELAGDKMGVDKVAVISGVGARGYYRKMGYHLSGPYMVKHLK